MTLRLRDLNVGRVDGKHEYLSPLSERDHHFFDAFLVPNTIDPNRMGNGDVCFVEGFRGTGKTSLLRWHAERQRRGGGYTDFILFKSDLTEQQRARISQEVGISWVDIAPEKMEVSQDFKAAWHWFVHHKLGEAFVADANLGSGENISKYIRLLGLNDPNVFTKSLGFLPRLEGATVRVKTDIPFFELELGGDFKREGTSGKTSLDALCQRLDRVVIGIDIKRPIYIYFDELEVFFHSGEQYVRDQRMVRDLLFTISSMNELFRAKRTPVHLIAAVRSEVIDSLGAQGQEIDRLVHDRGFNIAWHYAKRSLHHPLIEIVRRKLWASEDASSVSRSSDPMIDYFPAAINTQSIDAFLLDGSFYKPRDIVWRLTIAQKQFPDHRFFSQEVLQKTEIEYSSKLWDEIKYELSATYASSEIDAIEAVLSGSAIGFDLNDIEDRFERAAGRSERTRNLTRRRSPREVLEDLYRLGAIGNSFRVATTGTSIRNRWVFRGDPTLLYDKRMMLHPALAKRLSAVSPRRRS